MVNVLKVTDTHGTCASTYTITCQIPVPCLKSCEKTLKNLYGSKYLFCWKLIIVLVKHKHEINIFHSNKNILQTGNATFTNDDFGLIIPQFMAKQIAICISLL